MRKLSALGAIAGAMAFLLPSSVLAATWSDSGFQWHTNKPFTLHVNDYTTTGAWHSRVALAASEWSASSTADVVLGGSGRIKVSIENQALSVNGPCAWMTVTTQGSYMKTAAIVLNDTCLDYYAPLFTFSYQQMALCNELGHALGLPDHQTSDPGIPDCMAPSTRPGPSPTQIDFDKLDELYG